jgi:putative intracellular protease/amidase
MTIQRTVAVLIANGFEEAYLANVQKMLRGSDLAVKMVSSENGVVNGWAGTSWGCFFPVDQAINTALASDYAGLVIMGGDRAIQRLQKKAHTQRFINSFDRVEKPILAINGASEIVSGLSASLINTEETSIDDALMSFIADLPALDVEMDLAA